MFRQCGIVVTFQYPLQLYFSGHIEDYAPRQVVMFPLILCFIYTCRKVRHKNVVQFIGACTRPPNLCIVTGINVKFKTTQQAELFQDRRLLLFSRQLPHMYFSLSFLLFVYLHFFGCRVHVWGKRVWLFTQTKGQFQTTYST